MTPSILKFSWVLIPLALLQGQTLYSQVKDVSVEIYDHRKIIVSTKNGMPIPAEDKNIKIQVAGLGSSTDKNDSTKRSIYWIFGFTQKQGPKITEVKIEEVYADKPDRLVINDASPALKKSEWSTYTEATVISESTTPWLYEKTNSVFIFKFTVQFEGAGQSVLYQMSTFPSQAKIYLIQPSKAKKQPPAGT